jgi:hypothetical protein
MMIMVSMGKDYVSELQPPTWLLFIPQLIHAHGERWRNDDVDRGNSWLGHQSFLAILPAGSSGSKQEEWTKGMRIWHCDASFFMP